METMAAYVGADHWGETPCEVRTPPDRSSSEPGQESEESPQGVELLSMLYALLMTASDHPPAQPFRFSYFNTHLNLFH